MRAYLKKESKNLFSTSFGVSNSNGTFNKLTINNDNSMSIELNGFKPYSGAAMWNRTLNAGTYTISFLSTIINTPADATQNNNVLYIVFGSTFYNLVRLGGDQTKKYWTYKIVVPNDNTIVHLRWYTHLQDGVTYNNYSATFENIMLNEGETAIAYEPYGKNYQEIKVLGGLVKNPKNLFDISKVETDLYNNGIGGVWNNGDGTLTLGGQYYQNSAKNTLRKICPSLKEGDTVTLFFKTESPISKFIYCAPSTWYSGTSRTLTTEMLDSGLGFYGHHPNNPDLYETPCLTWDWQIVKGTEEVPMYIPQLFNINIKE